MSTPAGAFWCGVIEGFYGRPWTGAQRRELFGRMRAWGLNTYLYAPKDDLRHRSRWREPYAGTEAAELAALVRAADTAGIRFIYALAPGLDPDFASPEGRVALQHKAEQLLGFGCRAFALLFDDIVAAPASGQLGLDADVARPQIEFTQHLLRLARARVPEAEVGFCPTSYCTRMSGPVAQSPYLAALGAALDPDVRVMWTGDEIISEEISPASVAELIRVLRRPPLIWDNLFANDYDLRRLHTGPYAGRPAGLRPAVTGVLCNPNCEYAANFVPLRTLAAWHADPAYEPAEAARAAWREWQPAWELAGPDPAGTALALSDLEFLGDCFHLPFRPGPQAARWLEEYGRLLGTAPETWGSRADEFLATCARCGQVFERMTRLADRELLHTFYRHVWELKEEAGLMASYLRWQRERPPGSGGFTSAEHRPGTYRGGLAADLQRLLPMNAAGEFSPARNPGP